MDDNKNYDNSFDKENIRPQEDGNNISSTPESSYYDADSSKDQYSQDGEGAYGLFEGTGNFHKEEPASDFNTSGADYNSLGGDYGYYNDESITSQNGFYNTNIKRKKKRVPLYALVIAVIITAGISFSAPFAYNEVKEMLIESGQLANIQQIPSKTSKGAAIVATATKDRDGNKVLTTPEIVDKVGPAVVGIVNTTRVSQNGFLYEYFGGSSPIEQSSGSGVIISESGYIVTNNHVIEGASEITVILNTGVEYKARLIGADSKTDLAVLKIDANGLVYAPMGQSSELRVGDTAIAIGNPLGQEFAGTTTQGIISGLNRSISIDNKQLTLIQTDAAINPGNSGGALVDAYGHLIGINTAKISSESLEGLGFAIPIDEAKPVIEELIDNGYVTGRPVIGIGGRTVTKEDAQAYNLKVGVYVTSMTPDSPAYMAGVKIGDIIVECEGEKVTTVDDINQIKNKFKPGEKMKIKVYRQGQYKNITIVLGEEAPGSN